MTLSNAWEVTVEDVQAAMAEAGREVDMDEAERLLDAHVSPVSASVARAALGGDDLDGQADLARARIREILVEVGVLTTSPAP